MTLSDDEMEEEDRRAEEMRRARFVTRLEGQQFSRLVERKRAKTRPPTLLEEIKRRGLDLEVIYQIHMQHQPTLDDVELEDLSARRKAAGRLVRALRDAASLLRSFSAFRVVYRNDLPDTPQLNRFVGSGVPAEWCDSASRVQPVESYEELLSSIFGSVLTPVHRGSPFLFPAALIELFLDSPDPMSPVYAPWTGCVEGTYAQIAGRRQDLKKRLSARRNGMDYEQRVDPGPIDIHHIAEMLDDLSREADRVKRLLRKPPVRPVLHAQKSFRRVFAAHAQALTGGFQDEIGAAVFSMTFGAVEPSEYMRMRERDSAHPTKA